MDPRDRTDPSWSHIRADALARGDALHELEQQTRRKGHWQLLAGAASGLKVETSTAPSGTYRDAAQTTRTLTIRPSLGRALKHTLKGTFSATFAYVVLWLIMKDTFWLPLAAATIVLGFLPFAYRAVFPDRVEIDAREIRLGRKSRKKLDRTRVAYFDIGDPRSKHIKLSNRLRNLFPGEAEAYVVYAMTVDGETLLLSEAVDLETARASVRLLEKEFGFDLARDEEEQSLPRTRVEEAPEEAEQAERDAPEAAEHLVDS